VLNYEMESATLLTMCASQGLRAGMVAGVIVNRTQQEIPDAETMKKTESDAVKIVVEAARCPQTATAPSFICVPSPKFLLSP